VPLRIQEYVVSRIMYCKKEHICNFQKHNNDRTTLMYSLYHCNLVRIGMLRNLKFFSAETI